MVTGIESSTSSGQARRPISGSNPGMPLPVLPPGSGLQLPGLVTSETVIHAGPHAPLSVPPITTDETPSSEIIVRLFPPTRDSVSNMPEFNPSGLQLAHFRIEERIGMGGMGAVFRALDIRLQRHVALKLLAPSQCYDPASVKRFENEARAAARLDHDNVARVYFIGEERGLHFIAFEFINGSTIRDLIRRDGRISPLDTVNYALQIAYALKHTSSMGVVHRDIKPSNIIITPSGRAKLVDLGLARKESSESADLTISGTTLGTFDYISPEQAKDPRSVDVRSDIYSLGCTLYHMLTGQAPYPEGTALQKLLDHQNKATPDAQALNPLVSPALAALVRKMMSSDRNLRHQTPDHLIRELSVIGAEMGLRGVHPEGLVWLTARAMQPHRWTSQVGWIATAVALLAGVALMQTFPVFSRRLAGDPAFVAAIQSPMQDGKQSPSVIGPGTAIHPEDAHSRSMNLDANATGTPTTSGDVNSGSASHADSPGTVPATPGVKSVGVASSDRTDGTETKPTERVIAVTPPSFTTDTSVGPKPPSAIRPTPVGPLAQEGASDSATQVAVLTASGALLREYRTLEAACAAVEDGGAIELRFNGRRIEKPCRLNKKNVTVRAARGFVPVVQFIPLAATSTPAESRLISIQAGPVSIVNVHFEMSIPAEATGSDYALFGLQHPGRLHLNGVLVSVLNPRDIAATVVSLGFERNRSTSDMPRMPLMPFGEDAVAVIEVSGSLIRGRCGLANIDCQGETQLIIKESALALDRDAVNVNSMSAMLPEKVSCRITMEHVTALLRGHFLRIGGLGQGEQRFTVRCQTRNSILNMQTKAALVQMDAGVNSEDAYRAFVWNGERNFFGNTEFLWQIASLGKVFEFDEWTEYWGFSNEVGPNNEAIQWEHELPRELDRIGPDRFLLSDIANTLNPPVRSATDGRDAGCDVAKLPVWTAEDDTGK